jgi:hypothetical protein
MKTMTCKQLGGACDIRFTADTADEIIKAQDSHLKEMVAGGDEAHRPALKAMEERWKNPQGGMEWYANTKTTFANLKED